MALEGDKEMSMIFKGNDERGYLHGGNKGLMRRAQKQSVIYQGRVETSNVGVVCGTSGRNVMDDVVVGHKGDGKQLEKLGKKMDKQKQDILKWKNGVGEKIEQKLVYTYQKMGCIAAVECYSFMLGQYSVELTNSHKLVVKLGQWPCSCRQWQVQGLPCCHPLAVIAKANLWVIYNQLVHLMETNDMGKVDEKTELVVGGEELDDDYNWCILPSNNDRHPGKLLKRRESQT
ncbi:LOW QUALITY PROTEIN: hypothetical protein Cgig2_031597 [Carnegiea gigantea]|uniref:SWIM-type domain-containing protein n=1 Tax=Carnegiea gigantea TaxID=171969 RepID=A0A9Q1KCD8_9CARY|nr:LOW QUALITY PROTEIN: hypothetical protein Cgig2_031597 [Carnegiea gigantea]